jgi:predicted dithiol-disulfide oxidoreductase (DUF899 family)
MATQVTAHKTGTRKEWLAARLELLKAEKELTRRGDEVARQRQELPWVPIDKEYRVDTEKGSASLADLFRGCSQLLVYHFMFGPDFKAGCPSCSMIADAFNGSFVHLANHDVMLWAVSRAPLPKLQAYKRRMGWTFPWASSSGSDFNFDFNVSFTGEQQREGAEYNFRRDDPVMNIGRAGTPGSGPAEIAAMTGTDVGTYTREREGMSAFALEDGASSTTPIRPMRVAWIRSLACTTGSKPSPQGAQRDGRLGAPPRRVRQASSLSSVRRWLKRP